MSQPDVVMVELCQSRVGYLLFARLDEIETSFPSLGQHTFAR